MNGTDLERLVGMAVRAGVFVVPLFVAALAIVPTLLAMIQGEGVDAQTSREPGQGRMAAGAVQAKLIGVNGRLGVATGTVSRRTGHDCRRVTGPAILIRVPAS